MRNACWIGIVGVAVATSLLIGCGGANAPEANSNDTGSESSALRAASGSSWGSTAANLTTPDGIAGTVGWLSWDGTEGGCTGTLVARKLFLTAAHCVVDNDGPRDGVARVSFKQDPGEFEVDEAGIRFLDPDAPRLKAENRPYGRDLAVVPLLHPVPTTVVAKVAPVFTAASIKLPSAGAPHCPERSRSGSAGTNTAPRGPGPGATSPPFGRARTASPGSSRTRTRRFMARCSSRTPTSATPAGRSS